MNIAERVRRIVDAMPDDGAVELPIARLVDWLDEDDTADNPADDSSPERDLTVDDIMELSGRARSTICGWLREHRIEGAYRWNGREWRVPVAAWNRFLEDVRESGGELPSPASEIGTSTRSLDEYREVRSGRGSAA